MCGPAAFVVLKAHAFRLRGENKDAYDLLYVLMNYGDGQVHEVADRFGMITTASAVSDAVAILREDFASINHLGPVRAADFLTGRRDARVQADAHGYVRTLLGLLGLLDTR